MFRPVLAILGVCVVLFVLAGTSSVPTAEREAQHKLWIANQRALMSRCTPVREDGWIVSTIRYECPTR